jgi:nicotinate dehydrogenase subunit B
MREGLSRDGRHLYPAFPYTSFARASEADLQAIYAYLMATPAVSQVNRPTELAFPFSARPLMAAWNTMFHKAEAFAPDPARSELWNRGAYLVEGIGHCSVCHAPRNALGAEENGAARLSGGIAEGWEAPALNALSRAPIPWDEAALYDYLRTGFSPMHGAAGGPMAPVVAALKTLPDADLRAIAHYLAALAPAQTDLDAATRAARLEAAAAARAAAPVSRIGAQLYEGACAVCHEPGRGPALFGVRPSLALATAIHADSPETLLRVTLTGARAEGLGELGAMPAFRHHLDDDQIAELARYLRARFAPDRPAWDDLKAATARLRAATEAP